MTNLRTLSVLSPTFNCLTGHRQAWGNLHGSSMGLVISQIAQQHALPLIIITDTMLAAQRLTDDIRFYAGESLPLLNFPDWETLPYDLFSPHQDITSERLTTLYHLPAIKQGVLVLPINTLMHRLPPTDYVRANSLLVKQGQTLDLEQFRLDLEKNGYRYVSEVREHGEFSVRGGLFDLFPMGSDEPYRLELFDDEIDTIRSFDPETQRSREKFESIHLLPAREFPFNETAIDRFRRQWAEHFSGTPSRCPIYQDVTARLAPAGIEYYLPLFFEQTHTLFEYLPANSLLFTTADIAATADQFWQEVNERHGQLCHDLERPILPPTQLFLQTNEIFAALKHYPHILLHTDTTDKAGGINFDCAPPPQLQVEGQAAQPLAAFEAFFGDLQGRLLLVAETTGRRESLLELFQKYDWTPILINSWTDFLDSDEPLCITVAPLEQGLQLNHTRSDGTTESLVIISETQLFGERVVQSRRRKRTNRDTENIVRDLAELTIGAPVVHEQYGVGRYQGLMKLDGVDNEFLQLEYANQEKLYVPVASLHLISRFMGADPDHAPLHRLGSGQWERAKRKAAKQVSDVAVELLDIYAKRAARQGYAFTRDERAYLAFAQAFPFEETPDQQEAIDAVLSDMHAAQPMDRLVCGDVGFGKTEVAMRAAFTAINDNRQVAVLVPTTLLAQQHYQNFLDRFADWPIKVEQLSRFRSKKQQDAALAQLEEGEIDLVIGTHKLLQKSIKFKNLGLVIIDEEHRFGVKQKERFKELRAEVDILTLTATPIPRSLNMALSNIRDLSIIATPPSRRLAIKTFVKQWQAAVIKEAIQRELKRGGQVYLVHNNIETIEKQAEEVRQLVPEARVNIAHGQMRERELEQVMQDFYHRRFNVLVCTTIIETGIDVPSANTIIINRADRMGLAQLYQLRGRVGRSHHRAYAYLITPPRKAMTKDAQKRLDAIEALEDLGVGFTLATHDLEIRGAGEFLGDEQSGHMQEIGYSLYTELLERAVLALQEGREPELEQPLAQGTEIDLHEPALLPNDYLPDVHMRLILYKRIANAENLAALQDLQVEMIDRFGLLPEAAKRLLGITELKLLATPLGVRKIDLGSEGGYLLFDDDPQLDPMKVVKLVQTQPQRYRLEGQNKLRLVWSQPDFAKRYATLVELLQHLGETSK